MIPSRLFRTVNFHLHSWGSAGVGWGAEENFCTRSLGKNPLSRRAGRPAQLSWEAGSTGAAGLPRVNRETVVSFPGFGERRKRER